MRMTSETLIVTMSISKLTLTGQVAGTSVHTTTTYDMQHTNIHNFLCLEFSCHLCAAHNRRLSASVPTM